MDPIAEGDKIFQDVVSDLDWSETNSLKDAVSFLEKLIKATNGLVIVDFLDSGNWDCISDVEADYEEGFLKLHWRDYRDVKETEIEKEVRSMVFPQNLTSSLMRFKKLQIIDGKRFPVILLKGIALKDKEIKAFLGKGSSEFKILDNQDNFSKLALVRFGNEIESYTCFNTPIFSSIIIPKNSGLSKFDSKEALLRINLSNLTVRLHKVNKHLDNSELNDEDEICEKANTIRRVLEQTLKVELCYRSYLVEVKKDYSDLMLGNLVKLVKPFHEDYIAEMLRLITIYCNELSHDSGKRIVREKALLSCSMAILYIQFLEREIKTNLFPS